MSQIKRDARAAGLLYAIMAVLMMVSYLYLAPRFFVSGDAHATAQKIMASLTLYRLSILGNLVSQVLFIFVALRLYALFEAVDRRLARVLAALVLTGIAAEIVNIGTRTAPLVLLSREAYLSSFTQSQLESLAYACSRASNGVADVIVMFWGLWLLPFGRLATKSGYFPRILAWLLYASGVGYVVTSVTSLVLPEYTSRVVPVVTPLYFGELLVILWLAVFGAREPVVRGPGEGMA